MDRRTPIVYGVTGQILEFYPPEGVAAAAATYRVWEGSASNDQTPLLSGTATMDTTNLVIGSESGYSQAANRKRFQLGSTTGLVLGDRYFASNALGQVEQPRIVEIATDSYADAEHELAYTYAAGGGDARLRGFKHYFTVDPTFVADMQRLNDPSNPFKVEWSYTAGGLPRRYWTYFDVVRMAWQHGATSQDILDLYPQLGAQEWREQRGQKYARALEMAAKRVKQMLTDKSIDPNRVAEGPTRDNLVLQCALMLIAQGGITPAGRPADGSWIRERTAVFLGDFDACVRAATLKVSETNDGAISPRMPRRLSFTS